MKTIIPFLTAMILLLSNQIFAQNNGKMDGALNGFLNTEFMIKLKDMKIEAEVSVQNFKKVSGTLKPEAVRKVQTGYDQTAYRCNQLLTNIKNDFLNPKKLKFIQKFPDSYIKGLELELYQLSDFYAVNFQQPLADATGNQMDGGALLLILTELVSVTKGIVGYFGQIKRDARQYNESYLQQHLVKPFSFRYWNEINAEGMDIQPYDPYSPMDNQFNDMNLSPGMDVTMPDPLLNIPALPNFDSTNPYDNAGTYDEWIDQQPGEFQEEEIFINEDPIVPQNGIDTSSTGQSTNNNTPPSAGSKVLPPNTSKKKLLSKQTIKNEQ